MAGAKRPGWPQLVTLVERLRADAIIASRVWLHVLHVLILHLHVHSWYLCNVDAAILSALGTQGLKTSRSKLANPTV